MGGLSRIERRFDGPGVATPGLMAPGLDRASALWWVILLTRTSAWWWAGVYGLLWGLVYYGISLVWITHLHPLMWLGVPWIGSVAIALSAWLFITLWGAVCIAAWGVGLRWLALHWPTYPLLRVLGGVALWCAVETLRNYSPLDWSPLSLTQSPNNLWILHLARLSGPAIITAVLVASNGLWTEAWRPINRLPTLANRRRLALLGLGLLVLSHALGFGLYRQPAGDEPSQAITLGLVQGNVPTREKLTPAGVRQAMDTYMAGYKTLAEQGADAVITPEGALPIIWQEGAPAVAALTQLVRQTGVPLWLGTFTPVPNDERPQYTQSLLELQADGRIHARYDKVQLVPLGEYIPFEPVLGRVINRLSPLDSYLVPGPPGQTFASSVGIGIVGICYESAYSRLFRQQALAGGEFIVTASNNDPYPTWMMAQHHSLDVLRAVESDRWAIRVTNTGLSGLVDSHGHTVWLGEPNGLIMYTVLLYLHKRLPPYIVWGDWLTPFLLISLVAWSGFLKITSK
ncbi:MAG: apolipoprotein N-acyltransferase [Leptolyngbyaceae cyanobacterium SM2_5_2]|nr:apolipoprotein N-acyltransferase [Leptolyngbyaceae cyanobacterium SM2_5_2]